MFLLLFSFLKKTCINGILLPRCTSMNYKTILSHQKYTKCDLPLWVLQKYQCLPSQIKINRSAFNGKKSLVNQSRKKMRENKSKCQKPQWSYTCLESLKSCQVGSGILNGDMCSHHWDERNVRSSGYIFGDRPEMIFKQWPLIVWQ